MKTLALLAIATAAFWFTSDNSHAQCGYAAYYAPPVPVVAYYPPAPVYVAPAPVVVPTAVYTTRYRPVRGVYRTRVGYGYAPGYYYGW